MGSHRRPALQVDIAFTSRLRQFSFIFHTQHPDVVVQGMHELPRPCRKCCIDAAAATIVEEDEAAFMERLAATSSAAMGPPPAMLRLRSVSGGDQGSLSRDEPWSPPCMLVAGRHALGEQQTIRHNCEIAALIISHGHRCFNLSCHNCCWIMRR